MGNSGASGWTSGSRPVRVENQHNSPGSCAFCGKEREAVKGLVASGTTPGVAICDECVDLCAEIFSEQRRAG